MRLNFSMLFSWRKLKTFIISITGCALVMTALFFVLSWIFPYPVEQLGNIKRNRTSLVITDRQSEALRIFRGKEDSWTFWTPLEEMNPYLIQATIAVEDERFYLHPGIDPAAVARATLSNLWNCRTVSGASTLTMQLMRMMESRPRTFSAKIVESFRAVQCEMHFTKKEILEYYLNMAPYMGNYYGVEAVSRICFGRPSKKLTLAEAALIAGLPQSPARLRPDRFPSAAKKRRDHILLRMYECGFINLAEYENAAKEAVCISLAHRPFAAPHFARMLASAHPDKSVIRSTLDIRMQRISENTLKEALKNFSGIKNGAVVVIENSSSSVRALVGSPGFMSKANSGQINAATCLRSPGSALKPFIYAMAFERGLVAPSTALPDVPMNFNGYAPLNYDNKYRGPVSAGKALAWSLNIPAVFLLNKIGVDDFKNYLAECGIRSLNKPASFYGLTLALGGGEVSLLELTNAYSVFARGGVYKECRMLESEPTHSGKRIISEGAAYLITKCLMDKSRLNGEVLWKSGRNGQAFAWKTGTSYGHHDAWTVAYSPDYTVGVWLGNVNGRPDRELVGISSAAPVAAKIIALLHEGLTNLRDFKRPDEIKEEIICSLSGMKAGPHCRKCEKSEGIKGVSFSRKCKVHQAVYKKIFQKNDDGSTAISYASEIIERWPDEFSSCRSAFEGIAGNYSSPPKILSPLADKKYIVLKGEDSKDQKLCLKASTSSKLLYWFVDGSLLGSSSPKEQMFWKLQKGSHKIVCADERGNSSSVNILAISLE